MIKSSWFYVKFKHAEKVRTAPAAALRRALLGLSCSPSPGSAPGSVSGNRFSWGSRDKAVPKAAAGLQMRQQLQHGAGGREKLRSHSSSAMSGEKNRDGRDVSVCGA